MPGPCSSNRHPFSVVAPSSPVEAAGSPLVWTRSSFVLAVTRGMVESSRLLPPPLPLATCSRAAKPWLLDAQIFCQGLAP